MKTTILLCLLLVGMCSCKHDDLPPDSYLKDLSLTLTPLPDGIKLEWGPIFVFEEGMYGGSGPTAPAEYEIYTSETSGKELRKLAVVASNVQKYALSGYPVGKTMYVQVKATHPRLSPGKSNVATTNTGQLGTTALLFPSNTPYLSYGAWGGSNLIYQGKKSLEILRSDGTVHVLKSTGSVPVLSPDGRYVAFAGGPTNMGNNPQLFIEDVETGIVQLLDTHKAIHSIEWANDGKSLAYTTDGGLWTYSFKDGKYRWLTYVVNSGYQQIDWSPDDKYLVFTQQRDILELNATTFNLSRIPAEGGNTEFFLTSNWRETQPTFSPDGTRLGFISYRSGYSAVWMMDVRSGKIQQLTGPSEYFSYLSRLDWANNNQVTYTSLVERGKSDLSLKKVIVP